MNTPSSPSLKLRSLTEEELSRVFADIRKQFPPEEMKSEAYYRELLARTPFSLWGAFDGSSFVGYTAFIPLSHGIFWLDILAIFQEHQSGGYGSSLLQALLSLSKEDLALLYAKKAQIPSASLERVSFLLLEVEKANPILPQTLRRIAFYERLGAQRLSDTYILPNAEGGCPLDLWSLKGLGDNRPKPSQELVLSCIKEAWSVIHADMAVLPPLPSSFF